VVLDFFEEVMPDRKGKGRTYEMRKNRGSR
jgi:hypothetical protein